MQAGVNATGGAVPLIQQPDVSICITPKASTVKTIALDCAMQAGVNATGEQVLEWLVRADTADAFNISLGDVSITGVQQVHLFFTTRPY